MAKPDKQQQSPKPAKRIEYPSGLHDLKQWARLGWAEMQRVLYPDTNVGLQPSTSAGAIKTDLERHRQEAERQAQQQPAREQPKENEQEPGI